MMTMSRWFLLLLLGQSCHAAADSITFAINEAPPLIYLDQNRQAIGPGADLLRRIANESGIQAQFAILPWMRAEETAKRTANLCLPAFSQNPQRMPFFYWLGPMAKDQIILVSEHSSTISLQSLTDVSKQKLRVGVMHGTLAEELLRQASVPTYVIASEESNLKMLQAGRIDLWASLASTVKRSATLAHAPMPQKVMTIQNWTGYLACNINTDQSIINRLNATMTRLREQGAFEMLGQGANHTKTATPPATHTNAQ